MANAGFYPNVSTPGFKDYFTAAKYAREAQKVAKRIREIFEENGENFEEGDEKLLGTEAPPKPKFPFVMFTIAAVKDVLEIPAELSVIGTILTTIVSIFITMILIVWFLDKLNGGWWKKRLIKGIWKRLMKRWIKRRAVVGIVIELIPFLKIIPATTILVLMAYHHEKKIVKLLNLALEEVHKLYKWGLIT